MHYLKSTAAFSTHRHCKDGWIEKHALVISKLFLHARSRQWKVMFRCDEFVFMNSKISSGVYKVQMRNVE